MNTDQVRKIFYSIENTFSKQLEGLKKNDSPVVIILGGQPACGKSALSTKINLEQPERDFFLINGDEYRIHHPLHDDIIKNDPNNYSERTQIFSNVFTECLIEKAAKAKNDTIIEGTMRSPEVVIKTAHFFKKMGYIVQAHLLAVHPLISELSIYSRYQEQLENNGSGRLSEIKSHNEAVKGLINTADTLYKNKTVDQMSIFSLYAEKLIKEYYLNSHKKWSCLSPPSLFIEQERIANTRNLELLSNCINECIKLKSSVHIGLKSKIENLEMRLLETQKKAIIFYNK